MSTFQRLEFDWINETSKKIPEWHFKWILKLLATVFEETVCLWVGVGRGLSTLKMWATNISHGRHGRHNYFRARQAQSYQVKRFRFKVIDQYSTCVQCSALPTNWQHSVFHTQYITRTDDVVLSRTGSSTSQNCRRPPPSPCLSHIHFIDILQMVDSIRHPDNPPSRFHSDYYIQSAPADRKEAFTKIRTVASQKIGH